MFCCFQSWTHGRSTYFLGSPPQNFLSTHPFLYFLHNSCEFVVAELQAQGEVSIGSFPITLHPPLPTVTIPTSQVHTICSYSTHALTYSCIVEFHLGYTVGTLTSGAINMCVPHRDKKMDLSRSLYRFSLLCKTRQQLWK